jgi:V-type H+-transporting ATPase subunit E
MVNQSAAGGERKSKMVDGWDMSRMLKFIEQDSEEKAHELTVKANEEYSIEVAELTLKETTMINERHRRELAGLQLEKVISEGRMRSEASIRQMREKDAIISSLFCELCERCSKERMGASFIKRSVERLFDLRGREGRPSIYVMDKDRECVEALVASEGWRAEVQRMEESLLGGIVVRDGESRVLVNNSFLRRIKKIEASLMPLVRKALFGEIE